MSKRVSLIIVAVLAIVAMHIISSSASLGELEFVGFPSEITITGERIQLEGWLRFDEDEHTEATNIRLWVSGHEGRIDPRFIVGPLYDGDMVPITVYLEGTTGTAILHADDPKCPYGYHEIELKEATPTSTPTHTPSSIPSPTPSPTSSPSPTPTSTPTLPPEPTADLPTPTLTRVPTETPTATPTSTPTDIPEEPTTTPTATPTDAPEPTPTAPTPTPEAYCGWVEGEEAITPNEIWLREDPDIQGYFWVHSWEAGIQNGWLVISLPEWMVNVRDVHVELWNGTEVEWAIEHVEWPSEWGSDWERAIVAKVETLDAHSTWRNWGRYSLNFDLAPDVTAGECCHETRFLWKSGEHWGNSWGSCLRVVVGWEG